MAEFLLELYVSKTNTAEVKRGAEAARRAADDLAHLGMRVRFLYSIFVPGDETCFFLFEGESVDVVREAARRAGLPYERVAEAIAETNQTLRVSAISRRTPAS